MAAKHSVTRIEELVRDDGWAPIRRALGVTSFGINAWTAREAEAVLIPDHDEKPTGHEELYVVIAGHATFTVDGEEIDGSTGTIVFVPDPASTRAAVATQSGTTILSIGAQPGEAYRPRPWELNRDVFALFDRGEHAEARRMLVEGLDAYDDRGSLLYNIACADAQLGEADSAFEHLAKALDGRDDLRELAREDSDFAPIRSDPRFAEIVGSA
jgi:tetratricopeptide (TPR) repeat protein